MSPLPPTLSPRWAHLYQVQQARVSDADRAAWAHAALVTAQRALAEQAAELAAAHAELTRLAEQNAALRTELAALRQRHELPAAWVRQTLNNL